MNYAQMQAMSMSEAVGPYDADIELIHNVYEGQGRVVPMVQDTMRGNNGRPCSALDPGYTMRWSPPFRVLVNRMQRPVAKFSDFFTECTNKLWKAHASGLSFLDDDVLPIYGDYEAGLEKEIVNFPDPSGIHVGLYRFTMGLRRPAAVNNVCKIIDLSKAVSFISAAPIVTDGGVDDLENMGLNIVNVTSDNNDILDIMLRNLGIIPDNLIAVAKNTATLKRYWWKPRHAYELLPIIVAGGRGWDCRIYHVRNYSNTLGKKLMEVTQ